jgi:hypothetical protein
MSIRLDPRRLSALKLLAAESGVRPGELVTSWVEERIDAARAGKSVAAAAAPAALAELGRRLDELSRRVDELVAAARSATDGTEPAPAAAEPATSRPAAEADAAEAPAKRRPGRPRKHPIPTPAPGEPLTAPRIPLHEEIAAVIGERGPLTAAEIAIVILERGRYHAPRSSRPLDAATVNSRVSNPAYRGRFSRDGHRIALASG